MKREIKFRGLRTDGKGWACGSLINAEHGKCLICTFWAFDGANDIYDFHEVDPETVGQFTGLQDRNGVDIYEGDIDIQRFVFTYNVNMGGWYRMKDGEGFQWHSQACTHGGTRLPFEIIGSIHNNPELMEK